MVTERVKHIPVRTCIGCGSKKNKYLLLRLIVLPSGNLLFDPDNHQPGRGGYICADQSCLRQAVSRKGFARAFRRPVNFETTMQTSFAEIRVKFLAAMNKTLRTAEIVGRLEAAFGEPRWLGRSDVLDSLILTILSQSTNDRNSLAAYQRLREKYPRWQQVMRATPAGIADAIRTAGLANQKSGRIRDVLRWVHKTYGTFDLRHLCDQDPETVKNALLQLKGVGIKTISVVLMFCCGNDIFPVDTHVHRICRRLALVPERVTAEKTHELMQPLVPKGKSYSLHMNLLKLGRTICLAHGQKCGLCPLRALCPSTAEM